MKIQYMVTLAVALLSIASIAEARPFRARQIPSLQVCGTCHIDPSGGGARNAFGRDVEATLSTPVGSAGVDWPAVCVLDSDQDGATNGEELGDPNCTWVPADGPQTPTGDPALAPGQEPEDVGGCSATGRGNASGLVLLLGLATFMALRRRGESWV